MNKTAQFLRNATVYLSIAVFFVFTVCPASTVNFHPLATVQKYGWPPVAGVAIVVVTLVVTWKKRW